MSVNYKLLRVWYEKCMINSGIKINLSLWLVFAFVIALTLFILSYLVMQSVLLSIIVFIAIIDIILGLPVYLEESRISEIERHLPSALREMADILKSGGTYEYALKELVTLDFGPLNKEFEKVLIRLEEGSNFEDAMGFFANEIDSDLVKKVVSIIIDSIRSGAGLADVLEDIAEDARKIYKLEQDRKAKTTMQTLFIFSAGGVIAPAIFGLVITIVTFLIQVSSATGVATALAIKDSKYALSVIESSLMIYLFFESVASSVMISFMRDKNVSRAILYLPLLLLLAFTLYYLSAFFAKGLLSGMI